MFIMLIPDKIEINYNIGDGDHSENTMDDNSQFTGDLASALNSEGEASPSASQITHQLMVV